MSQLITNARRAGYTRRRVRASARWRACYCAQQRGFSYDQIAEMFGVLRSTAYKWVWNYIGMTLDAKSARNVEALIKANPGLRIERGGA